MEHNRQLQLAFEYAEHTGISIFLTGKAGTGKTTFLRKLRETSSKTIITVAPTGVAAINAGGVTIHSFFQLPTTPYVPGSEYVDKFNFSKQKLRIIRALDLLVIDEISMVRADLLDAIDNALRKYRRSSKPFGGVQLLMIGDLQQLAPVVTHADEQILRPHYDTNYFFGSKALGRISYVTIVLEKVFRQHDNRFIDLLNHIRDNRLEVSHIALLNSRLNPDFDPDDNAGYIRLTTHNATADSFNASKLASLPSSANAFNAEIKGTFPEYSYPTAPRLELKVGAQVMFVKNDPSPDRSYYNGKIGIISNIAGNSVSVVCEGEPQPIVVKPQTWENLKYTVDPEQNTVATEVQGSFTQIPLRLAWAITIHKSQGLTFDKVIIDAGRSFAPGQVYVALSRCRTLEGIILTSPIGALQISTDSDVSHYIDSQKQEAEQSISLLPEIKTDYHRNCLVELFNFSDIVGMQQNAARLLAQHFRTAYPELTTLQGLTATKLHETIIDVADKWIVQLSNMNAGTLQSDAFNSRIMSAASYFGKNLSECFGTSLDKLSSVKSRDKKATQRLKELTAELSAMLGTRLYILNAVATQGFSVPSYLKLRRTAELKHSAPDETKSRKTATSTSKRRPYPFWLKNNT